MVETIYATSIINSIRKDITKKCFLIVSLRVRVCNQNTVLSVKKHTVNQLL